MRHSFTPRANLSKTVNLLVCFLQGGRKQQNLEETHADTGRPCETSLRQEPELRLENHLTLTPLKMLGYLEQRVKHYKLN